MAEAQKKDALQRLKILIDSSPPIVVIETVEEVRAVLMVRVLLLTTWAEEVAQVGQRPGCTRL